MAEAPSYNPNTYQAVAEGAAEFNHGDQLDFQKANPNLGPARRETTTSATAPDASGEASSPPEVVNLSDFEYIRQASMLLSAHRQYECSEERAA